MNLLKRIVLIALTAVLVACSGTQVQPIKGDASMLASYPVYAWRDKPLAPGGASANLVEMDALFRAEVNKEMAQRGYRQAGPNQQADILVDYVFTVIEEDFPEQVSDPNWDSQFDNNAQSVVPLPENNVGRLILFLGFGHTAEKPIWATEATRVISRSLEPEARNRLLLETVRAMLADVPGARTAPPN